MDTKMERRPAQRLQVWLNKTGPAKPLLIFLTGSLLLFFFFRILLTALYFDRVRIEPQFYKLFLVGIRIDLIILCYYLFLPALFFFLLPANWNRRLWPIWTIYFTFFTAFALFMEMASFAFVREFDLRPDSIFIRYLDHYKEVLGTIWNANRADLLITLLIVIAGTFAAWRLYKRATKYYSGWNWKWRLLAFPFLGGLLFLGARSSLAPRPANISTAYWSERSKLADEFTLNATYSVITAFVRLHDEQDPSAVYGKMPDAEVFARVRSQLTFPDSLAGDADVPFLHEQKNYRPGEKPLNVVILLEESLGAEYTGFLGGTSLTPHLDSLSREGLAFTNLYSTGTRTVRGIEAVVTGFLPTPGNSVVNLGLSRTGFFTAASLFKQAGYHTDFIYGGQSNFDEMRSFFMGNGFEKMYDEPTFRHPAFKGVWGVSDEDLAEQADSVFRAQNDRPFFALMLSTSNHTPFEFPDGRIDLAEKPKGTVNNAIKYADYSIGKFFRLAKKSPYFNHTLFLVVADHNTRVFGDAFVPVKKFHIPGILLGPGVPHEKFTRLASQVDLMPTLLHFAGLSTKHPMVGRDLMALPEGTPGRCFMQYGQNYGYMVEDTLTVLKPFQPPAAFLYDRQTSALVPMEVKPGLAKDALAFSLLPWKLYQNRKYHLK